MPDYQNGKIYKIFNCVTDDVYIGSTTQLLCNRMKKHRESYTYDMKKSHLKIYQAFSKHGMQNFYIELLEKYPCSSKEELLAREGYWIRNEKPSLNTNIAGRTDAEYAKDNKERCDENKRRYYEKNKELIYQRNNERIQCECGCTVTKMNMQRHKATEKHKKKMNILNTFHQFNQ